MDFNSVLVDSQLKEAPPAEAREAPSPPVRRGSSASMSILEVCVAQELLALDLEVCRA